MEKGRGKLGRKVEPRSVVKRRGQGRADKKREIWRDEREGGREVKAEGGEKERK